MKTSTTQKTSTPNSKEASKESQPSSQTAEQTTPIKRFHYRFKAKNHQGLPTFCEGEVNADGFMSAGNIIFNELHPKVKDAELELSETPLEPKNKEWISVDEELPDADITVLGFNADTGDHKLASYDDEDEGFEMWFNDFGNETFVTHWKPLESPTL